MQRVPLEELCLQIKVLGLGSVVDFFGDAIEPPSEKAIKASSFNSLNFNNNANLECLGNATRN
jgi:hypothetical protein